VAAALILQPVLDRRRHRAGAIEPHDDAGTLRDSGEGVMLAP
jgi:hypothetical protein